jgi:ergothioneine biosynthesis protein EgtC
MCRLVAYLGEESIFLDHLIIKSKHSLTVQSYQPQEMTAGLLNADGFGIGWYVPEQAPFLYKNTLPIWSDINLGHLSRFVQSHCILANVRSATPGQSVDLGNCQPFNFGEALGIHNGYIDDFRRSLYRPIRLLLEDKYYQNISGNTDSEHILALFFQNLSHSSGCLVSAMQQTLNTVLELCGKYGVNASLNLIVSDGKHIVASRCASRSPTPSLYWLQDPQSNSFTIASEPLFDHPNWLSLAEKSILAIAPDLSHSLLSL